MTQNATDNLAAAAPPEAAAAPAAVSPPPAATDALRDYGHRLTETLRTKGQELASEPAKRRALWPVAMAVVAGLVVARDVLAPTGPSRASAAVGSLGIATRVTSEKSSAVPDLPSKRSSLIAWLEEPVAPVERNIFALTGPAARPTAESATAEPKSGAIPVDSNPWRDTALAGTPPNEVVSGRAAAASGNSTGSKVQARQIRLQSTLMGGPHPAALVNGQMVREGDVVATGSGASRTSYRVLKIEARRVILEREGIRSEIPLD